MAFSLSGLGKTRLLFILIATSLILVAIPHLLIRKKEKMAVKSTSDQSVTE
jgi:hypothetical protein